MRNIHLSGHRALICFFNFAIDLKGFDWAYDVLFEIGIISKVTFWKKIEGAFVDIEFRVFQQFARDKDDMLRLVSRHIIERLEEVGAVRMEQTPDGPVAFIQPPSAYEASGRADA